MTRSNYLQIKHYLRTIGEALGMTIPAKAPHNSHPEHKLKLKNCQELYTCDGCKEQGFGKRYRCEHCNFNLHKDCMFPTLATSHELFEASTFEFLNQPPSKVFRKSYCNACGKAIKGFVYHSVLSKTEDCNLHPCCRNLKTKLYIDGVKFQLQISDKVSSKCKFCKKKKLQDTGWGIRGWSYVSEGDNYHFHVYCLRKMVLENCKNGTNNNLELRIQVKENRNGGGGAKYLRIVKVILHTITCIILGDPTMLLSIVDLVSN